MFKFLGQNPGLCKANVHIEPHLSQTVRQSHSIINKDNINPTVADHLIEVLLDHHL